MPVVPVERPFEKGRFYRLGSARMSLATAARAGVVGYSALEGWEPCSGTFAYSIDPVWRMAGIYRDVYSDVYRRDSQLEAAVAVAASVWVGNEAETSAWLTSRINAALMSAGYWRADGDPIR